MQGPLHPSLYDTSDWQNRWWYVNAPAWEGPPPLDSDEVADVMIIGGGFAGLSTAIGLAERGIGAAVLDAAEIGWGSSGRNGGIVGYGSYKRSEDAMVAAFGQSEMDRYHGALRDGIARTRAFAEENGVPVQGEAELILAHSDKALAALQAGRIRASETKTPFAPDPHAPMARLGGIYIGPCFGIQPLMYVQALADRAMELGVKVYPQSEVLRWHRGGGRHRMETAGGSVTADKAVLAANGFMPDNLHPKLAARAVPVISQIGVTRRLTNAERDANPWLDDNPVATTKNLLYYLRLLPEGRLLFGQRDAATGSPTNRAAGRASIRENIAAAFAGMEEIEIDYHWNGPICATRDLKPSVGALPDDPSVFHAFAWHGSGINAAQTAGRLLAEVIATGDQTALPAPLRGLPPKVPLPSWRPLWVRLAIARQQVQDLFN